MWEDTLTEGGPVPTEMNTQMLYDSVLKELSTPDTTASTYN